MQKKNGYLSVKAMTRKDRVKIYPGTYYTINPHTEEGTTFLSDMLGDVQIELPQAIAGRKFTFISNYTGLAGINRIEIFPQGGIYSSDRIFDPDSETYLLGGYSIQYNGGVGASISLECHNDGYWSALDIKGTWEQPDRTFETLFIDDNGVTSDALIAGMKIPIEVQITVTNDKFEDDADAADITLDGDIDSITVNDDLTVINANQISFTIGAGVEKIVTDTGEGEIEIAAGAMVSRVAVNAEIKPIVAGITDSTGSLTKAAASKVWVFIVEAVGDLFRSDIALYPSYVLLQEKLANLVIDTVEVNAGKDTLTITTESGAVAAGTSKISINPLAFIGVIKDSGIATSIEGTIS